MTSDSDYGTCDCGHSLVAHELVTREGRAWFSVEGMEMTTDQVDAAAAEGRLYLWCGHCEDGCHWSGKAHGANVDCRREAPCPGCP